MAEVFEIIQAEDEKPIDYQRPILTQRRYWLKNDNYNKVLLSRVPLEWNEGLHQLIQMPYEVAKEFKNTGLFMLHLKYTDLQCVVDKDLGPMRSHLEPKIMNHDPKDRQRIPKRIRRVL